jgi:excisionase family DNA binding protein
MSRLADSAARWRIPWTVGLVPPAQVVPETGSGAVGYPEEPGFVLPAKVSGFRVGLARGRWEQAGMPWKRALTTGEVARHCGVNFRTVIRWIERGHLKSFKLPGRGDNRVVLEEFLDFLQKHEMPVPAEFQTPGRKVLVVEDDPLAAEAIQHVLVRAGFETRVASDGFTAGALFGTFAPTVATLDLRLPGLDGLEVLRFVRSTESIRDVKILVLSARPREELDRALAAGADDILQKPFESDTLVEKVCRLAGVRVPGKK